MAKLVPYLLVKNSLEAIESYKKVFEAEIVDHNKFTPEIGKQMGLPDNFDYENSTMHAFLKLFGNPLYMADSMEEASGRRVEVLIEADSREQIEGIYKRALENGYKPTIELHETFWGAFYCSLVDPFGVGWQVNYQMETEG